MSLGAPSAPNFTNVANQQAAASQNAVNQQTAANRPNISTPWGDLSWTQGANGQWDMNVALNPQLQEALNAQMGLQADRSNFAQSLFGGVQQSLGTPFDFGAVGEAGRRGEDALYGKLTSRLDPYWQQQENQQRSWLANQGLDIGSQAYQDAYGGFNRGRNDAYGQAALNAALGGQGYAQNEFAMQAAQRMQPLNELNALLSGQQVSMPQFPSFNAAGQAQTPDLLGAAQAQYGADLNSAQMNQQLFGDILGAAGGLAAAGIGAAFPPAAPALFALGAGGGTLV